MSDCSDLCNALVSRLRQLGFVFDESKDHGQVLAALAQVRLGFASPLTWSVTITVTHTAKDPDLPANDSLCSPCGTYKEEVTACCATDAIEGAKDQFLAKIAIARVDDFQMDFTATRAWRCSLNHRHHLLVPPSDACPECGENDLCDLTRDDADDVHCRSCGCRYQRERWY